jgi:hypothetical protein
MLTPGQVQEVGDALVTIVVCSFAVSFFAFMLALFIYDWMVGRFTDE